MNCILEDTNNMLKIGNEKKTRDIFIEHLPNNTFIKISCMTRQESVNSIIEYKSVDSKLPFKIFLCCFSVSLQDDSWKGEKISDIEHAPIKPVYKYSRFLFSYL